MTISHGVLDDYYDLYNHVMYPFTARQERKTRKDYDTKRVHHSTSFSSAFGQPSSSYLNDDDNDGNDEGTSRDVTRLQALVDKKKIVISKVVICESLQLNDAEGVVCLPNEEIFASLDQMGYEKPSTKLTFYKAFFSSQWKFLIHTILQSLSAKRTFWNEFSTAMASAVICLSKGQKFNFSKYIFDSLVRNVDSSSKFYMYPRFIQLIIQNQVGDLSTHTTCYISPALTQKVFANMRRVGKGFLGVETPLFEGMIADRQPVEEELGAEQVQVDAAVAAAVVEDVAEDVVHMATLSPPPHGIPSPPQEPSLPPHQPPCLPQPQYAEGLEIDKAAQQLEIVKLNARVKKLEKINMVKSSKLGWLKKVGTSQRDESLDDMENVFTQGRIIVDMDQDEGIELAAAQEKDAEVEGRHADKQAELYNLDQDHSSKVLSMQEDDTEVQEAVEIVTTAKIMTEVVTVAATQVVAASTPIPAAKPKILNIAAAPVVSTRRRKGVVLRDLEDELPSNTPAKTPKVKDKGKGILIEAPKPMKKKDQIEMDTKYVRKLQEEINKEHEEAYKNIDWNAALDHKAAKRRKLSEKAQEAEDIRKRLEIVQDEDDDVFVEATLLAQKVPIVDYQIVVIDNKPKYKIIRADDTYQLYISFTTLLKNFDREDLETLWKIVRDRFSTSKPTNFLDEYLLLTLKTMFEEPDGQDAIWRNQKSVHGLALVKRWKLLTSCGAHDLYTKVSHSSSPSNPTENLAFVSSSNTDSTTDTVSAATSVSAVCAKLPVSSHPNIDSLSNAVIFSFFANQSTNPQLDNEDLKQIDVDDLEEIDLRWQMVMLTIKARRLTMCFDMSKVKCYNCHRKGHFARECRSPKDTRRTCSAEPHRRTALVETSTSNALVSQCDGIKQKRSLLTLLLRLFHHQALLTMRLQPSGRYNDVPPPIIGNFMPPKHDLVFHTAPIAVETAHSAFNVKISSFKHTQDLSHTNRPSAPIIEEWVFDSEDDSETTATQIAHSFVQSTKQVTPPRHSVQPVEAPILATTLKLTSPKTSSSGKRKNRKTCHVCRSVDHLIKDCNFHDKRQTQPTPRNYAHMGFNKQHASFSNNSPQKHIVPTAMLTQSKPVSITAVRPIYADVPKIMVTRPRHAHSIDTKSKSTFRRHMTHGQSPKTSNSPPRVTTAQASVFSAAKAPQIAPSFVQTSEHVKPSRHSYQPVEAPILAATPKPTSHKTNCSSKRKNRKTRFECRDMKVLLERSCSRCIVVS
nr:hypothetical protein [Tanacetum cinerariifolium]